MSDCLGRDLQTQQSSVAEEPVRVFEFWRCYVLPHLGRGSRGGGAPAPRDPGGGEQPMPQTPWHHPRSSHLHQRSAPSPAVPSSRGLEAFGVPLGGEAEGAAAGLCRLLATARRGDAGCEAGAGWKGASWNQEMSCGCWPACTTQEAKRKSRLGSVGRREEIWGKETLSQRGGRRLEGDGEWEKGERTGLIPATAGGFWLQPGVASLGGG